MLPTIDVSFHRLGRDRALEGAVQRWVARLEAMSFDVCAAAAAIEPSGRKHTTVRLTITLGDGRFATGACTHIDPFVAVSDAFRAVRREVLAHTANDPQPPAA